MRVWPGQPYPLGATWDGSGVNFALFSEHATSVELCLFDSADAHERVAPHRRCPSRPTWSGTATCPTCGPASSTATASTGRTSRPTGHRFNPNKVLLDPYAKAIGRDAALGRRDVRLPASAIPRRTCRSTSATTPRSRRWPRSSIRPSPGATTGRRARPGTRRSSTSCTSRASPSCIPDVPENAARHLRRRWRSEPAIEHLQEAGRHGGRAAAGASPRRRPAPGRAGPDELLGLQHARLLRPEPRYRRVAHRRPSAVREFKTMVRTLHAAGIEVILDVVYNHTAEGNQLGPDAVVARHRQRRLLPARRRRPALLHGLHRLRQHAEHAATRACCS